MRTGCRLFAAAAVALRVLLEDPPIAADCAFVDQVLAECRLSSRRQL